MDWGMLGYFIGDAVEEDIPVADRRDPRKPIRSATNISARPRRRRAASRCITSLA